MSYLPNRAGLAATALIRAKRLNTEARYVRTSAGLHGIAIGDPGENMRVPIQLYSGAVVHLLADEFTRLPEVQP